MPVHLDSGGHQMTLKDVRKFVEYTKNHDEKTLVEAGVIGLVGKGLSTAYTGLVGLETREPYKSE